DGPGDARFLAGMVGRLRDNGGHLQVGGRQRRNVAGGDADVVAGERAFEGRRDRPQAGVGDDDDVFAGDIWRELERVLGRVAVAGRHHAIVLDDAQEPLPGAVRDEGGTVRKVNLVEQDGVFRVAGALVFYNPRDGEVVAAHRRGRRADVGNNQVGGRRRQDGDGPGLVIVVIELVRIVRVDVHV